MPDKFEKFTERARKVFSLAQEEAQRLNHNYIGTEHLLLGIVREGEGIAARVLDNLGVSLSKVRSAVEFIIGRGDGLVVGDPNITPRAKKVIELSMDEARRLNNHYIGTEHLLLGLVREGEGIAAGVLESLGVSLERVRQSVMQVVSQSSTWQVRRVDPGAVAAQHAAGEGQYSFTMQREEFRRLAEITIQMNRSVDDMIVEAIRRVWLTEESDADQPPPHLPMLPRGLPHPLPRERVRGACKAREALPNHSAATRSGYTEPIHCIDNLR